MLPLARLTRLLPGRLERAIAEHFRVEPVGISRRRNVRRIVRGGRRELRDNRVDELRVDERAIAGDTHDDIGTRRARRLVVAVQDVVFAAAVHRIAQLLDVSG